jgi:xanthine dehydrogenase YagR molybdenum-binding subunit
VSISIGAGIARVDGPLKVAGAAQYPGDVTVPGALHAALVLSTIANGRIVAIDERAALATPGVVAIYTHRNLGKLQKSGVPLLLQEDRVWHDGQAVGLVVADTMEHARRAAALVRFEYDVWPPITTLSVDPAQVYTPADVLSGSPDSLRGNPRKGLEEAAVRIERRYTTPTHNHSPLEPHVAVASWENERVVVHTSTQAVFVVRAAIASALGMPARDVRVVSRFVGGGFCSKGRAWLPPLLLVVAAARQIGKPIRLELRREDTFTVVGNRQRTIQTIALGAAASGQLTAIRHDVIAHTSAFGEYADPNGLPSRILYACPNVSTSHRLFRANVPQPVAMRAPGEGTGTFALESAIDEIAHEIRMDPLEFRTRNFATFDQDANRPWSSNGLEECYRVASQAFGWAGRPIEPRSLRDGAVLRGWGMASAYYPVHQTGAQATVSMQPDGTIVARCGTQDVGTGTYTVIAQLVAATLAVPVDRVRVEIGDTTLPVGPPAFGSMSAASLTPAVTRAAEALRALIADHRGQPLQAALIATGSAAKSERAGAFSSNAYGAVFVEVEIDEELGRVRVSRVTAAYASGRILNARTARSQYIGGLVFGIGMALHEETRFDADLGRIVTRNFADYLVPVHADVPDIDVHLVEEVDEHLDTGGVKGIGMLGTVGTAAAIANAVFHATGRRIRDLPIRMEQFLQ